VLIDYPDAWQRARRAFHVTEAEAHFDPLRCAETLIERSAVAPLQLERVCVHHGMPVFPHLEERKLERRRVRDWTDRGIRVRLRSRRVPGHMKGQPGARMEMKGLEAAIAIEATMLLGRGQCDHVIVFSHRPNLAALADAVLDRHGDPRLIEFASWRTREHPHTVPLRGGIWNIRLRQSDFANLRIARA
jgi:hypothetical protein